MFEDEGESPDPELTENRAGVTMGRLELGVQPPSTNPERHSQYWLPDIFTTDGRPLFV